MECQLAAEVGCITIALPLIGGFLPAMFQEPQGSSKGIVPKVVPGVRGGGFAQWILIRLPSLVTRTKSPTTN